MSKEKKLAAFGRLLDIMDDLREKCPWDRKQTTESLRKLTIEETFELSEAILNNDSINIEEELGDILLHIVFYAKIGEEQGNYDIESIIHQVCEKLIRRHPHIYGDITVKDEEEVKANWEKIKLSEGKKSTLSGVPDGLPSLIKAYRIQEKAKKIGFEWETIPQVWDKVKEELGELDSAIRNDDSENIEEEMGDVLFALINLCRFLKVDPEESIEKSNKKFISRFQWMESYAEKNNLDMETMNLMELDRLWEMAKIDLRSKA